MIYSGFFYILIILLSIYFTLVNPSLAQARLIITQQTPQEQLIRANHTLRDDHKHSWEVVLYTLKPSSSPTPLTLRLISVSPDLMINHQQPLIIKNISNQTFLAPPLSSHLPPNVGEYNLTDLLSNFPPKWPIYFSVPLLEDQSVDIAVPYVVQLEWHELYKTS